MAGREERVWPGGKRECGREGRESVAGREERMSTQKGAGMERQDIMKANSRETI